MKILILTLLLSLQVIATPRSKTCAELLTLFTKYHTFVAKKSNLFDESLLKLKEVRESSQYLGIKEAIESYDEINTSSLSMNESQAQGFANRVYTIEQWIKNAGSTTSSGEKIRIEGTVLKNEQVHQFLEDLQFLQNKYSWSRSRKQIIGPITDFIMNYGTLMSLYMAIKIPLFHDLPVQFSAMLISGTSITLMINYAFGALKNDIKRLTNLFRFPKRDAKRIYQLKEMTEHGNSSVAIMSINLKMDPKLLLHARAMQKIVENEQGLYDLPSKLYEDLYKAEFAPILEEITKKRIGNHDEEFFYLDLIRTIDNEGEDTLHLIMRSSKENNPVLQKESQKSEMKAFGGKTANGTL